MARKTGFMLAAAAALLTVLAVPTSANAHGGTRWCERQFDATVQKFDEVFLARDLAATMSYYHEDATKIAANGNVRPTKADIENLFKGLFAFEFTATFPEVKKTIHGCETAVLITDFRLEIASIGFRDHFLNTLTFVRERGQWKILVDVSTKLPV
jgi:ketosteroid isomerase-like protein